ncbi:MAG: mechanosensitive ion channel domain-containing protein [Verrucomicrobiota bacterium]|nr:mechanosensitive ion channel domain-containing protein [Verrucomicrobiota bacterium]
MMNFRSILPVLAFLCVWACLPLLGANQAPDETSATDTQPASLALPDGKSLEIPEKHLKLLLQPLTKDELEVEAGAWLNIVKGKVTQISELTIKAGPAAELTKLREEKALAITRFRMVIAELESKGGDASAFLDYANAVGGAQVDVTDAVATWDAFTGWLVAKEGGVKWGLQALKFLGIIFVFWIIARFVRRVVRRAAELSDRFSELLEQFMVTISFRAVMCIGLLVALGTVGVNVGALLAVIGGASFIIGFALQDTLGNFASGVMLLIYRPFDVGDVVEVGGVNGKIDSVSLVSTTIRTFDNKVVLVPNRNVWGQVITNASASDTRRVDMIFGIGYEDDVDKARSILERIVSRHELVLEDPEPVIQLHELADSSVNFICRPWVNTGDYWQVHWDVIQQVKAEFDREGISIPYPQQDIHIHQAG